MSLDFCSLIGQALHERVEGPTEDRCATIERAVANKVPGDLVLADAAHGRSAKFRDAVRLLGFDYAVGVDATTV